MTEKLKKCPFCGKKPYKDIQTYSFMGGYEATITCSCGAKVHSKTFYKEQDAIQDGIDRWNRRAE